MNYPNQPRKTIIPPKAVLHHTRSLEMTSSELYKIIQRVLVDNKDYFQIDRSQFKGNPLKSEEVKQELIKKIQLDKIPAWFEIQFKLDYSNPDIKNQIVDIFWDAISLNTEKWKRSDRVVFSRGRVIVSKNEDHPVHIDHKKHTQWEKRLSENQTTLLTFWNIYDALRSQYHTLKSIEKDQEKSLELIQDVQQLAAEIKESAQFSKDGEFLRRLNSIIDELKDVRDVHKLWAKIYQLEELSHNKSIAVNQLQWSANKFEKRFDTLSEMLWFISFRDIPKLERIIQRHKESLTMFLAQIAFKADQEWVFGEYRQRLATLTSRHMLNNKIDQTYFDWKGDVLPEYLNISPFWEYYQRILTAYESKDKEALKSEARKIEEEFSMLRAEHNEKLNSPE